MEDSAGYKGLNVYKKSYEQLMEVYRIIKAFPEEERFNVTSQLRRAATSIPLNIAEGYSKKSRSAEYCRYLMIAVGSGSEVQVLLDICKDLRYLDADVYQRMYTQYTDIRRMLYGLMKAANGTPGT